MKNQLFILSILTAGSLPATAQVFITEVAPWSSGSPVGVDWFELTNTGAQILNIAGWKMDDNSNSSGSAVAFRGITTINPGQSIVFFEGNTAGTTDLTLTTTFNNVWGTAFVFGVNIGAYGGSGVSLGTGGDAVNIYNSGNVLQANVSFGPSPTAPMLPTFDNAALLNNALIATPSMAGTNGAYSFVDSSMNTETGSPGVVPELSTLAALLSGLGVLALRRRRH